MKNPHIYFLFIFLQCSFVSNSYAQSPFGEINGIVIETDTQEEVYFAKITIEGNGQTVETMTDFSGYFAVNGLPPGLYSATLSYVGAIIISLQNVLVKSDEHTYLNLPYTFPHCYIDLFDTKEYQEPLLKKDHNTNKTFTRKEIQSIPFRNMKDISGMAANSFDIR